MDVQGNVATFPNGLKLKLRPNKLSKQLIYDATRAVVRPEPPQVYIEQDGRFEANPNDPTYAAMLDAYETRRGFAASKALLVLGTELLEKPDDVEGPDDTDWEMVAALKGWEPNDIPQDRYTRYDYWLRYFGLIGNGDELIEYVQLVRYLFVKAGMTAEAAAAIVATFRTGEGRGTNHTGGTVANDADGHVDHVDSAAGA